MTLILSTCSTTRKLINTNGNTEGIFSSVNFRGILLTEIFPQYIPRELPWEKKLKQRKKKDDVSFLPTELPTEFFSSVNLLVNCEHYSSCQLQRESPSAFFRELQNCSLSNCTAIVVLYGENHRRIEKSSVLFGGFLKKFN